MQQGKRNPHAEMGAQIGSASIVMIFAVLCLTVFAALSFETAGYEQRLAEKGTINTRFTLHLHKCKKQAIIIICEVI